MKKLTAKNYHTDANPYLSNSKISLFLKSKEAYKKHYIDKVDGFEMTPSLLIGRAVDLAFEKGKVGAIDKMFCTHTIKEHKEIICDLERLTSDQMDKAKTMAKKILGAPFYKELKMDKAKFQVVLTDDEHNIAGMLDCLNIDEENNIIQIIDLKTAAPMSIKSKRSWFYHGLEYGYWRQLAVYKHLVALKYPEYVIQCSHIVIGSGDYYPIKIFEIADTIIDCEWPFIVKTLEDIRNEKEWKDYIPDWHEAQFINNPNDDGQE